MKNIYFIRHAKAKKVAQNDFIRELSDKGKDAAKLMANRLKSSGIMPQMIISSPANRTAKTAKIIAKEIGFSSNSAVSKRLADMEKRFREMIK